jgi:alpha-aminoadipic semialdehyde synthase
MALLDAVRSNHVRLFDYECITEGGVPGAPRAVAFGRFAGYAGMINGLRGANHHLRRAAPRRAVPCRATPRSCISLRHAMRTATGLGERALHLGCSLPFLGVGSAYMYPDLDAARDAVRAADVRVITQGVPRALAPFTVAFTGSGAASSCAQDIFRLLPHTMYVHALPSASSAPPRHAAQPSQPVHLAGSRPRSLRRGGSPRTLTSCSAACSSLCTWFLSAPSSKSKESTSKLPASAALCSGVSPRLLRAFLCA